MIWLTPAVALLVGTVTGVLASPVLRRLPEPSPDTEDAATKTPYAALARPGFGLAVGVLALLAAGVSVYSLPPAEWLTWAALASLGALAITVDAVTTWLPRALTLPLEIAIALGVVVHATAVHDPQVALRAALGALAFRGFFHVFSLPSGGIGYGDVRLMTGVGAATAAHSTALATAAILIGTLVGAAWGIAVRLRGGRGVFAYGPSLWSGPFLALALLAARAAL